MALTGKNGVTVKLYNSSNVLIDTQVTSTLGGVPGSYVFSDQPYGTYQVLMDDSTIDDYGTFKQAVIVDDDDPTPGRTVIVQGTYGVTDVDISGTAASVDFQYNKTV